MPEEQSLSRKRSLIYVVGFIFNLSYAIPTYFNSTFLAKFLPGNVGIVYTASSLLAIACFIQMPKALKRFGNLKVTTALLVLEIMSLAGLVIANGKLAVICAFLVNFVTIALINFTLDIFLESYSSDLRTGKIRGFFLTCANLAWVIAPVIASFISRWGDYDHLYIVSALLLAPVLLLLLGGMASFRNPEFVKPPFWKTLGEIWADRNLKGVLMCQFLLQFFYAWMIIYTPIYLLTTVGFDNVTVGIILSIMLVPFVLLEEFLGRLADSRFGEQEMLGIGFVLMALFTILIAFVTDHNMIIWAAILFMTRVGAAMVEVMADTYFFKHVDATKTHLISFSRMSRPFAYVISTVAATILLTVFDMKGLFVFLGFLMLYGLRYALAIEDTK